MAHYSKVGSTINLFLKELLRSRLSEGQLSAKSVGYDCEVNDEKVPINNFLYVNKESTTAFVMCYVIIAYILN